MFLGLLLSFIWTAGASPQSASSAWTWEFVSSHVPKFAEKGKESQRMLVVEVVFHNKLDTEQRLTVAQEEFHALTGKAKPIEVLGLLFKMMNPEGARSMAYKGGIKRMETLKDVEGDSSSLYFDSPGPVELVVEGGHSYKQRVLLARPKGKKPFRMTFSSFPALEIPPPR